MKINEEIEMIVDFNKRTLSYKENGRDLGIAKDNLPKIAFYAAITLLN